jgi:hypothetical protein
MPAIPRPALEDEPSTGSSCAVDADKAAAIREQLRRLCESPAFRTSKRCRQFLEYVVQHSLLTPHEPLKERMIGLAVFGREPAYDTSADPIVRVTAGEIRKRLGQYYADPAHQNKLRIDLPSGHYAPTYSTSPVSPPEHDEPAPAPASSHSHELEIKLAVSPPVGPDERPRHRTARAAGIVVALGAAAALLSALLVANRPEPPFERFWAPVVTSTVPVLVCTGSNDLYELSGRLREAVDNTAAGGVNQPLTVLPEEVRRVGARYVSVNDAVSIARYAALLQQRGTPYQVREIQATSFADLRAAPTVLIGMFSNAWTLELGSQFRFSPEADAATNRIVIRDRQRPAYREWSVEDPWPALKIARDFALVSRVRDKVTGNLVVIAAGITPYGTTAAAEFLTTPHHLEQALRDAPPDWPDRNLQIVLETRVIGGAAGPPGVKATHFW